MTKNPFLNAAAALMYIAAVVSVIFYSQLLFPSVPETIFIPMAVLSLLVFSAACMAYIFFYHPLQLFADGKKKEGIDLFLKTLGIFGAGAILLLLIGTSLHRFLPAVQL